MLREARGSVTISSLTAAPHCAGSSPLLYNTHSQINRRCLFAETDKTPSFSVRGYSQPGHTQRSVRLHAHMLPWTCNQVSRWGQTDDTLSSCSTFSYVHPSSIGGYPNARTFAYAHTPCMHTHLAKKKKKKDPVRIQIQLQGSLLQIYRFKALRTPQILYFTACDTWFW